MTDIHYHGDSHDHDHGHHHHHDHDDHHHRGNILTVVAGALHLPGFGHDHDHGYMGKAGDQALSDNELGIRTVWAALLALGITTLLQIAIYAASGSVALLADTVHNLGDALNSVPLLAAFYLARRAATRRYTYGYGRAEDIAGILIVVSIAFSAGYILLESFQKLVNPQLLDNLGWVAAAALIGFLGNEVVGLMQIRVGRQIGSEAMVADGLHARVDGLTSLAVLIAVIGAWFGYPIVDPIIGIVIGITIVGITWNAIKAIWFRLMDAVDPQLITIAQALIEEHEEIIGVQRLQLRWVGHRLHGEIVIGIDNQMSLDESAKLSDHINHHLVHGLPNLGNVTIQTVPVS